MTSTERRCRGCDGVFDICALTDDLYCPLCDTAGSLRYWPAIYIRDHVVRRIVVVTDGDYTPHTQESVRRIITTSYGEFQGLYAPESYDTSAAAHAQCETMWFNASRRQLWINRAKTEGQ